MEKSDTQFAGTGSRSFTAAGLHHMFALSLALRASLPQALKRISSGLVSHP